MGSLCYTYLQRLSHCVSQERESIFVSSLRRHPRPVCRALRLVGVLVMLAGALATSAGGKSEEWKLRFQSPPLLTANLPAAVFSPHLDGNGGAWESWEYLFRFSNGYTLLAQFQLTNKGPGSHRGIVVARIIAPNGTATLVKNSRDYGEWSYSMGPAGMDIYLATHQLHIAPPSHKVSIQATGCRFTIEAESVTPMVQPGRLAFSEDEFYDLTVLAPRLKAQGVLEFTDGPTIELRDGTGVALYVRSNMADHKQMLGLLRCHTFDGATQVSLMEFTAPEDYRYQRVGLLLIIRGSEVVYESYDYDRRYSALEPDPEDPHYPVPRGFVVSNHAGASGVQGEVKLRLIQRYDILDWVKSGIGRFFLRRTSHPIEYLFDADYELNLTLSEDPERISGRGFASLLMLNDPPETPW
jgi:hypothetical protein